MRSTPVLGDASAGEEGRLYVPKEQAEEIRKQLLPKADIITPNPFEMGWLAGLDTPNNNEDLLAAARSLKVETVLATSASAMMRGNIANLLLHEDKATLAEHRAMNNPPQWTWRLSCRFDVGELYVEWRRYCGSQKDLRISLRSYDECSTCWDR